MQGARSARWRQPETRCGACIGHGRWGGGLGAASPGRPGQGAGTGLRRTGLRTGLRRQPLGRGHRARGTGTGHGARGSIGTGLAGQDLAGSSCLAVCGRLQRWWNLIESCSRAGPIPSPFSRRWARQQTSQPKATRNHHAAISMAIPPLPNPAFCSPKRTQ